MKYPRQIYSIKRSKKTETSVTKSTLSVDMKLYLPEEDDSPMEMHAGYSLFSITLINVNGTQKIAPHANFPIKDTRYISQKTEWCNTKLWDYTYSKQSEQTTNNNSPAYSCKIAGKFNQKTPVEILLEKGDNGKKELELHCSWLKEHGSEKYAKINQAQIEAIQEGIELYNNHSINSNVAKTVTPDVILYDSGRKFFRSEQKDGLFKCYQIKITFNAGMNYPYLVSIHNSYNTVTILPDKTCRIGGENKFPQTANIRLTAVEWTSLIEVLNARLNQFEIANFAKQCRIMEDNSWKPEKAPQAPI